MSTTKTTTSTYGSVTAVDDTLSASQDASITYASWQILGNDIFVGFPNSDLSIASVTSVSGGSVVLNPDGSITFAPNDDFSGVASFTYAATYTAPRLIDVTSLVPSEGAVVQGQAGDFAGWSVSSAGDVNGDGFADVIVGAPRGNPGDTAGGQAYVVFGHAGGIPSLSLGSLSPTTGFAIGGSDVGNWAGLSVSSAGDVNHDGFGDLIIGAPSTEGVGAAYLLFAPQPRFIAVLVAWDMSADTDSCSQNRN